MTKRNNTSNNMILCQSDDQQLLTKRQQRFVQEYLVDLNATRAYQRVYECSEASAAVNGCRLLRNAKVAHAIREALAERAKAVSIDQQYVISNLWEVVERCMQPKPVMQWDYELRRMVQATDHEGNRVWTFDSKGAIAALELLGKHLGMFSQRVDVNVIRPVEVIEIVHAPVASALPELQEYRPFDEVGFTDNSIEVETSDFESNPSSMDVR